MRIFVASWFFPPNSSSEGFVTYKLLRNSRYQYDVVCSTSHQWGYEASLAINDSNIHVIAVDTESIVEWQKQTIEIFSREHQKHPYAVIMTRSMPPESLSIGLEIKRKYPKIKWIASLGDPVGNNPYSISPLLLGQQKSQDVVSFVEDLSRPSLEWRKNWTESCNETIAIEARLKKLQDEALLRADVSICPTEPLRRFMQRGCLTRKFEVLPHAFDESLYDKASNYDPGFQSDQINLVYLGYSDQVRSLLPVLKALRMNYEEYPELASHLCFHVFGNNPYELSDYAESFQLTPNLVRFHGNCSYWQSLKVMQLADWLVHVDAFFPSLGDTGGSVFFAGKLADYMGASKPVLALTGEGSPADRIVSNYGGISLAPWDLRGLSQALKQIAKGQLFAKIDYNYRSKYSVEHVAREFDDLVDSIVENDKAKVAPKSQEIFGSSPSSVKIMTVCVPCYNGGKTLKRCLDSVLAIENPLVLDVIIVDDGSTDNSAEIAQRFVERFPGTVRLIRKPNGGHGSGINTGIANAAGMYFRVIDADDWVDSFSFSSELLYLQTHCNNPVDICYSDYRLVDSKTGVGTPWVNRMKVAYGKVYDFNQLDESLVYFTMHGSAFRTEILRKSALKCREHCYYTDSEYILKPIPYVKKVVFLKKPVYRYWVGQEGQSVSPASFVLHYEDHFTILRTLIDYYKGTKMPPAQSKYFYRILKEHIITHYRIMREFDQNKVRGKEREQKFESYLRKVMPELLLWIHVYLETTKAENIVKNVIPPVKRMKLRTLIKSFAPYGMVRMWQKYKYGF